MAERTDAEILDGSPFVTTFEGVDYTWRQRSRREQREIRNRLWSIGGTISGITSKPGAHQVIASMESINAIINFCEDYNDEMARDIDKIEDAIKKSQSAFLSLIEDVYEVLFDEWVSPWVPTEDSSNGTKKKTKRGTRTTNRKSTKS